MARHACWCSADRRALVRSTTPRSQAFEGRASGSCTRPGALQLAELESPGPHYDLRGYIEDFGQALLAADLVVSRAGGSIFEVAAHGRPAVLIPYPYATADHQTTNARYMEQAGAAVVIPDSELTPARLAQEVGRLLAEPTRLQSMGRAAVALARPDAASAVAAEVLKAARSGWTGPGAGFTSWASAARG